jgi:class 3 adenylate cyclase
VLTKADFSQLFDVLQKGEEIRTTDAGRDNRLSELYPVYLRPLGCESLLVVPVRHRAEIVGSLWFENDRMSSDWSAEEFSFAQAIANMLALRFSVDRNPDPTQAEHKTDGQVSAGAAAEETGIVSKQPQKRPESNLLKNDGSRRLKTNASTTTTDRAMTFARRASASRIDPDRVGAQLFSEATVLLLRFTDPLSLAERMSGSAALTTVDEVVSYLEDHAGSRGIEYMRVMGDEIVCATGIDDNLEDASSILADMALAVQDRCTGLFAELNTPMEFRIGIDRGAAMGSLFAELNTPMEFRIGIDRGAAMGSPVGRAFKSYNIWGEAVRFASLMAKTGIPGGIQVSEKAYFHLRADYLFKARGRFYLPGVGEVATFLLTGKL